MNWLKERFSKVKDALFKTKSVIEITDSEATSEKVTINDEFFEDLSEKFIRADIGFDFSEEIVEKLKSKTDTKESNKKEIYSKIKECIKESITNSNHELNVTEGKLNIILICGVNGSGKTTSIGKLAKRLKGDGKKVLIAAGDTFRAAASEQLSVWSDKAGVDIYAPEDIKKPDAVVFSGIEKAKSENYDYLLIDTAGRLHSQTNLMEELKKIDGVINKKCEDLKIEKLIVLDATIGQNAILQAKQFSETVKLSGIILAKLDSSAKGGVVLSIMNQLSLPVKLIGTGEKLDDIVEFNFEEYLDSLLS